ncbi:MAG: hypothetical protein IJR62_03260 [Lachnospiraceae bacterium]|nr:hypothetical protein [Lachnospiraceae bacterium]
MGDYLQSFDIRNKKGISVLTVLGAVMAAAGLAGHLHLMDGIFTPEALAANIFLNIAPNYKTGLVYVLIGLALLVIGSIPDKYVRADLYTDAIVLYRKEPQDPGKKSDTEVTEGDVFLFDDLESIVSSQRGLGDPQTLLIIPEKGGKIQLMVPPRNGMPAEAEAVWRSYCVRYNRMLDAEETGTGLKS